MKSFIYFFVFSLLIFTANSQDYYSPESIVWDEANQVFYISNVGEAELPDGFILKLDLEGNKSFLINSGLADPKGMIMVGTKLYVTDVTKIIEIDIQKKSITNSFNITGAVFLNDIEIGNNNVLYTGDMATNRIFKFDLNTKTASALALKGTITAPNGLLFEKASNKLYAVAFTEPSVLYTINLNDNSVVNYNLSFSYGDGIAKDGDGQLIISAWGNTANPFFEGEIYQFDKILGEFVSISTAFSGPADIIYFSFTDEIVIPEMLMDDIFFLPLSKSMAKPELLKPDNNITNLAPLNANFEWKTDASVTKYVFHLSKSSDFINDVVNVSVGTQNNFKVETLEYNTKYYWKVVAYSGADSSISDVWNFTTGSNTLQAVNLISPANNSILNKIPIKFEWNKGLASKYELQIDTSPEFTSTDFVSLVNIDKTNFEYNIEMKTDTRQYWRVRNYDDTNSSPWSEVFSFEFIGLSVDEDNSSISIFPNPVLTEIVIQNSGLETIKSIKIFDLSGKLVYITTDVNGNINIDLSNFTAGTYFVEMNIEDRIITKKIIKK